jgi:HEAT repeat protein
MIDDTIIKELTDKDPNIRIRAITGLRKLGLSDASELLVSMLDEKDTELKQSIISTLMEIGKPAIPYLIDALRFPNVSVQKGAAKILAEIGDASISVDILNLLKDTSSSVRTVVLEVLSGIKDLWSLTYIREFVNDPEPNVRATTARALGNFEDKLSIDLLLSLLTDNDATVKIAAIEALSKFNDSRVCDSLWQVTLQDNNQKVRDAAISSLKKIGESILKPYENNFSSNDIIMRAKTLQELTAFGKAVLIPLLDFSKHHNPSTRALCAEIIGNIGDNIATRRLIELANDIDQDVRLTAITALGKIKSESALRFLISALKNPDPIITSTASQALEKTGKELVKFLPNLLAEQDLNTQVVIARLIGSLGDPDVVPMLAEHLKTPQMWLRRALCFALGETKNPIAANIIVEQCMTDPETLVRTAAAKALGKLKITIGTESLTKALHDKEESVQTVAIEALAEIGDTRIGPHILPFLSNDSINLKITAIRAVTHLNYIGAIPSLKKLVRSWPFGKESDEVKNEARVALKKLEYECQFSKP